MQSLMVTQTLPDPSCTCPHHTARMWWCGLPSHRTGLPVSHPKLPTCLGCQKGVHTDWPAKNRGVQNKLPTAKRQTMAQANKSQLYCQHRFHAPSFLAPWHHTHLYYNTCTTRISYHLRLLILSLLKLILRHPITFVWHPRKWFTAQEKQYLGNIPKMEKWQEWENCTVYSYIYSLLLTMLLVMTLSFQNLIKLNQLHPKLT